MLVCLCNSLKTSDVKNACAEGHQDADAVFKFHGTAPCCGKCIDCMNELCDIESIRQAASRDMAAACAEAKQALKR